MNRFKMNLLVVGVLVVVLGGVFGKLAIDNRIPSQSAGASSSSAAIDNIQKVPNDDETNAKKPWKSKVSFQDALQIAEAAIGGKAYNIERETEGGKPVIEVGIGGQQVFVDAESSKIVLIENLQQKGDSEDIEDSTEALELQKLATVPIQEALQTGESFVGNQAHSVELKNKEGNLVYEVVVELQEVSIDAGNGKVLATEAVGQSNKNDASQADSSIQIPSPIAP